MIELTIKNLRTWKSLILDGFADEFHQMFRINTNPFQILPPKLECAIFPNIKLGQHYPDSKVRQGH